MSAWSGGVRGHAGPLRRSRVITQRARSRPSRAGHTAPGPHFPREPCSAIFWYWAAFTLSGVNRAVMP